MRLAEGRVEMWHILIGLHVLIAVEVQPSWTINWRVNKRRDLEQFRDCDVFCCFLNASVSVSFEIVRWSLISTRWRAVESIKFNFSIKNTPRVNVIETCQAKVKWKWNLNRQLIPLSNEFFFLMSNFWSQNQTLNSLRARNDNFNSFERRRKASNVK